MSDEDMQHTTPSPDNSTETSPTIRDGGNTMISVGPSSRGLGYDFRVPAEGMGSRARYLGIIEYESGGLGATNYNACSTSTEGNGTISAISNLRVIRNNIAYRGTR
ncbi:hypothetical protein TWF173_001509 [Orbilia oligospora]|nr:hypothetical protein TWF173_001509 [Orbilia oligospora]